MATTAVVAALVFGGAAAVSDAMPIRSDLPHAPVPDGYGAVPGGKLAHAACVHRVPSGSVARRCATTGRWFVRAAADAADGDGVGHETPLPKCAHPLYRRSHRHARTPTLRAPAHGPAWIVDAVQDDAAGHGFSYFATNWTVPPAPASGAAQGTLLYYWPGLEDETMGDVLQPVLQYGVGPYGGGEYWLFQSWFVSGDGTVLVGDQAGPLSPGSAVFGSIALSADGQTYTSTAVCPAGTPGAPSVLSVAAGETQLQTRAYVTVEVYNIAAGDCSVLPPSNALAFTAIELRDGHGAPVAPHFTAETQHAVCRHAVVLGDDEVTITWQS